MKKGFTLIEIIIGLAIVSVLTLMLGSIFSFSLNQFSGGEKKHDEQFDVRLTVDLIENELRNSMMIFFDEDKSDLDDYNGDNFDINEYKSKVENSVYYEDDFLYIGSERFTLDNVTSVTFNLEETDEEDPEERKLVVSVIVDGKNEFLLEVDIHLNNIGAQEYVNRIKQISGSNSFPDRPFNITGMTKLWYLKPGE